MPELNTHRHRASRWNRRRTAAVAAFATLSIGGTLIYTVTAQAAVTCKDTVWKAKYYANTTFKGDPKKTVCDTTISENYGTGDPAGVTLPKDNFGVRWEMKRNYGSGGPFAFTVAVQDGIRVYLDGTRKVNIWKNVSSTQKKTVNLTVPKGTHTIRVDFAAFTGKANVKFTYAPRTSKTVDKVKPLTPSGAKAAYSKTTGKTAVTWSRNVEMDLAGYKVYRRLAGATKWTLISGTTPITTASYTDLTPGTGDSYEFAVAAVDKAGNASANTAAMKITTVDKTAPAQPAGLTVTDAADGNSLAWTAVSGAKTYKVYRSASAGGTYTSIGTATGVAYSDTTAADGTTYFYAVSALDAAGNESARSTAVSSARGDHTAPSAPSGLAVEGTEAGNVLTWTANTDDTTVYEIWAKRGDGSFAYVVSTNGTTYTDIAAIIGQTTSYYIVALDKASNISASSVTVTATRPAPADTTDPAVPTGLTATGGKDLTVPLAWNAVSDSDFAGYNVYRDGVLLTPAMITDGSSYTDDAAEEGRTYTYTVTAVDTSGNESEASAEATATTIAWPLRDLTVGKGGYATVQAAVDAASAGQTILVKPGTHSGTVNIPAALTGLTIIGGTTTATDTVITSAIGRDDEGTNTLTNEETATLRAYAAGLTVSGLTVENAYEEGTAANQQAVALWADADKQTYSNIRLLGNQDTFYSGPGRQFVTGSYIEGDTDFVFGEGTLVIDASTLHFVGGRKNGGSMTAAKTAAGTTFGFLVSNSQITADASVTKFYLGRPWGADAQVTVRDTAIAGAIDTAWKDMSGNLWTAARFGEYLNTGDGAAASGDTTRPQFSDTAAKQDTKARYLKGADNWDPTGTLATEDFTAPDAVTDVTATAGASSIVVAWSASPAADLAGYRVYRDGTLVSGASLLAGASESYEDATVTADTQYGYTVTAVDTSGNESAVSATATSTVVTPSASPSASESASESPSPSASPSPSETVKTIQGADAVVAADGSGDYTTVQAAVSAYTSATEADPYIIAVNPGTYREVVSLKNKPYTQIIGAGGSASDTVIVYDNASGTTKSGGGTYGTGGSATFTNGSKNTLIENLTISNDFDETAHADLVSGYVGQAVALLAQGDRQVYENVRLLGNQDTLYSKYSSTAGDSREYFHNSYIEGDVDFLCGNGIAVFDETTLKVLTSRTAVPILAAPQTPSGVLGFLIVKSTIETDGSNSAAKLTLGRPWAATAQMTIRDTAVNATVTSAGYQDWGTSWTYAAARFSEYNNSGTGASATRQALTDTDAASYQLANYLAGTDSWAPQN